MRGVSGGRRCAVIPTSDIPPPDGRGLGGGQIPSTPLWGDRPARATHYNIECAARLFDRPPPNPLPMGGGDCAFRGIESSVLVEREQAVAPRHPPSGELARRGAKPPDRGRRRRRPRGLPPRPQRSEPRGRASEPLAPGFLPGSQALEPLGQGPEPWPQGFSGRAQGFLPCAQAPEPCAQGFFGRVQAFYLVRKAFCFARKARSLVRKAFWVACKAFCLARKARSLAAEPRSLVSTAFDLAHEAPVLRGRRAGAPG